MAWDFLEAVRSHKFQSQIFWTKCRNFWVGQSELNFWDYFRTVRVEFLGLFSDRIFETIFEQFWTVLRFGFDLGTDVFGFCGVFWYHNNLVTNREGTKRCPVLYGSEIWAILCIIVVKINNKLLCVKIMFIYICLIY